MQAEQQSERLEFEKRMLDFGWRSFTGAMMGDPVCWYYANSELNARWFGWREARAALSHPSPQGWQPISTAPEGELVVVGWLDDEDTEHQERHAFDLLEEEVWQGYFNEHEHYLIAGVARGRSEDAPYTHWQRIGAIPAPPEQGSKHADKA